MARATVRRRNLIATAAGGAALWLVGGAGESGSPAGLGTLGALCAELDCPPLLGEACRAALPVGEPANDGADGRAKERTRLSLAEAIFSFLPPKARRATSTSTLARLIREQSREDFRSGRIVIADGWMLSRTEAHLYALAARGVGDGRSAG